jgi:hypothetical protein
VRETGRAGFKSQLIKELELRFPGIVLMHLDPNTTHQGIPDLLLLYMGKWAMLEAKGAANSKQQPNQDYWVDYYNELGYASFVYPENVEDVMDDLQQTFSSRRRPRLAKR